MDEYERIGVVFGARPAQLQCWGVTMNQGSIGRTNEENGIELVFEDSPACLGSDAIWFSNLDYDVAMRFGRHIKNRLFFRAPLDVLAREVAAGESGYAIQARIAGFLASGICRHGLWRQLQSAQSFSEACFDLIPGARRNNERDIPLQWQICADAASTGYWAGSNIDLSPGMARYSGVPSRHRLSVAVLEYGLPDFSLEPEKVNCQGLSIRELAAMAVEQGKTGFVQVSAKKLNPLVSRFFKAERDTYSLEEAAWLGRHSDLTLKRAFLTKTKPNPLIDYVKNLRPYSWFDGLYSEALATAMLHANAPTRAWLTSLWLTLLGDTAERLCAYNCWVTGINVGRIRVTSSVFEQEFLLKKSAEMGLLIIPEQAMMLRSEPLSLSLNM